VSRRNCFSSYCEGPIQIPSTHCADMLVFLFRLIHLTFMFPTRCTNPAPRVCFLEEWLLPLSPFDSSPIIYYCVRASGIGRVFSPNQPQHKRDEDKNKLAEMFRVVRSHQENMSLNCFQQLADV
jgi:hypothetical protein